MEQMPGIHWTTDQIWRVTSELGQGLASQEFPQMRSWAAAFANPGMRRPAHHANCRAHEALRGFPSHFEYGWKYRSWEIRLEPLRTSSGEIIGCWTGLDITDRKKSEEPNAYQARHDALTGLAKLQGIYGQAGAGSPPRRARPSFFTLLLLDLEG